MRFLSFFQDRLKHYFEVFKIEKYLFKPCGRSKAEHISSDTIRWLFLRFRRQNGLDENYYTTANNLRLHRLTPHTIRHYAIHTFLRSCGNDYNQAKLYSNHSKIDMIVHYAATLEGIEKQANVLELAFASKLKAEL